MDHEHVYDSDSILSIIYLPESLTVLGGGVIASEYASIFQTLGTKVTMIDRYPTPLGFLDSDLTDRFVKDFEERGGRWIGNATVQNVTWDGVSHVVTELDNGEVVRSEKLLSAAGRIANVKGLDIHKAGLEVNDAGVIPVDSHCKTQVDHIYAAGDVIGPPSLASASMEQGRRASCSALGMDLEVMTDTLPMGIYGNSRDVGGGPQRESGGREVWQCRCGLCLVRGNCTRGNLCDPERPVETRRGSPGRDANRRAHCG